MMRQLLAATLLWALPATAQVTYDDLLHAADNPADWVTYSGSYMSQRHTKLDQITPENAGELGVQWVWQANSLDKFQATPLAVDGILYVTEAPNDVVAIDGRTGRVFWEYEHDLPAVTYPCCGRVNRGLAILGDALYFGTLDCRVIALDAGTGRKLWDKQVCEYKKGYSITVAPLAVKDKIILGTAGGEFGIRGWMAAYDAKTGDEVWKFNTIPGPGEPGHETWVNDAWKTGGGSIWLTGSYDPELNLLYWGIGNPSPDWNPDVRPGDNLYTDSVLAINPDTGKLAWHFQFTPHDEWDWDAVQIPVLADLEWEGELRKLLLWANRNAFYYVLDRTDGEFLSGAPFARQDWAKGLDKNGRPILNPGRGPSKTGSLTYPGVQGATNWYSPSLSPSTGLFYFMVWDDYYSVYYKWAQDYEPGVRYLGGNPAGVVSPVARQEPHRRSPKSGHGLVRAMDPLTMETKWEFKTTEVSDAGMLTTASDLLFTGSREGHAYAFDARNGDLLWRRYLGGQVAASPMSYEAGGRQFIAIAVGHSLYAIGLDEAADDQR